MNLPNRLTVSRFGLTALFLAAIFSSFPFADTVSLALFIAASLTDYFDGKIARRDQLITKFGILMDPLADKILMCSAFIAFVDRQWLPGWMVVVIVARELAITGLRLLAASQAVVLAAEGYGKHKTISQFVAVVSILVLHSYHEWGPFGAGFAFPVVVDGPWMRWFTNLSIWAAVILTLFSGGMYLWRNRGVYLRDT